MFDPSLLLNIDNKDHQIYYFQVFLNAHQDILIATLHFLPLPVH